MTRCTCTYIQLVGNGKHDKSCPSFVKKTPVKVVEGFHVNNIPDGSPPIYTEASKWPSLHEDKGGSDSINPTIVKTTPDVSTPNTLLSVKKKREAEKLVNQKLLVNKQK